MSSRSKASDIPWRATVLTIFPEMFPGPLAYSLAGRALQQGVWSLETVDIRDFASDKHRSVDDTPAGGGPGMVMRADVLGAAIDGVLAADGQIGGAVEGEKGASAFNRPALYLSPRGRPLTQDRVSALADGQGVVLICGRFEGIDERLLEAREIEEVSIGDFVLSGGEPAAIVVMDACVRLLPGVMGAPATLEEESFSGGLLEYPHYTRPQVWEGREIPKVLLSGDHAAIDRWRREKSEELTRRRRPDLWARRAEKGSRDKR